MCIDNIGFLKLYGQLKKAWDSSIMDNAEKWGFETTGPISREYGLAFTPMELNPE